MRTIRIAGMVAVAFALTLPVWPASTGEAAATDTASKAQLSRTAGFYLLWSQNGPEEERIFDLPFVAGGQIVVQWGAIDRGGGHYDFSALDRGLAAFAAKKRWATVQINGNEKPTWLFDVVPHVKERLHSQVRDRAGTLMFWHPAFQAAQVRMLQACARHLRDSPDRRYLAGIRLNFNAVGTEQFGLPPELVSPVAWIMPAGMNASSLKPFDNAVRLEYQRTVIATYVREFSPWVTVFVRNNYDDQLAAGLDKELRRGELGLFHTSAEAEPRSAAEERKYGRFYDYCRSGLTIGYSEPWASAWGEHGGKKDPRWCSAEQWNYWTMLLNLHCGVSLIGEYFANLRYATSSTTEPGPAEFMAAYRWGADYVGRHALPAESPGAWVAMRDNHVVKAGNQNVPEAERVLIRFTGDCDWLMTRLPDQSSGVGPVGPSDQRFGAFARKYPPGTQARVRLDPAFLASLKGEIVVRVTYLDDTAGPDEAGRLILASDASVSPGVLPAAGTGRWCTVETHFPVARITGVSPDWQIGIKAGSRPLLLHMIEVRRGF